MKILSAFDTVNRRCRIYASALVICFAAATYWASDVEANPKGNSGGGNGWVGIGVGVGVNTLINQSKKKKKKKKATKKTNKKKKKARKKTKKKTKKTAAKAAVPIVPKYRSKHILGVFLSGMPDEIINDVAADFGLQILGDAEIQLIDSRVVKFAIKRRMSALRALELANDPRVISAQPNYLYQLAKPVQIGTELQWGELEDKAGDTGDNIRWQSSIVFRF